MIKPFLDTTTLIFHELQDLEIDDRDEWLYERYTELRKLVKIIVSQAKCCSQDNTNWADTLLMLDSQVKNFNLSTLLPDKAQIDGEDIIPLCITDLMEELLFSKVE